MFTLITKMLADRRNKYITLQKHLCLTRQAQKTLEKTYCNDSLIQTFTDFTQFL